MRKITSDAESTSHSFAPPLKILILGAKGRLGAALARSYAHDACVMAWGREEANFENPQEVARAVQTSGANVVINCAALTNVDTCEAEQDLAEVVNAHTPTALAQACAEMGARMIHISTDYVFDGQTRTPYTEDAEASPLSWYGKTKRNGECGVLSAATNHAVVRVSWVFGPDRDSFIDKALHLSWRGEPISAVADKWGSPTYTLDAAEALRALMNPFAPGGIYHLCNHGVCSWHDWAQHALDTAISLGLPMQTRHVKRQKLSELTAMTAPRPIYTAMSCKRLETLLHTPLRGWREAVADYVFLLHKAGRLPTNDSKANALA